MGMDAHARGQLGEAQAKYCRALKLNPRHPLANIYLAIVFASSDGFLNEAVLTAEKAALLDGEHWLVSTNRALICLEAGRMDEAIEEAERGVKLAPAGIAGNPARMVLAMVVASAGEPERAVAVYDEILKLEPAHPAACPNSCFNQTLCNVGPKELLEQRRRWYEANRYKGKIEPHIKRPRDLSYNPLRVGYVGGDFKQHSASFIFASVLLHHSSDIEMYLYSSLPVDPEKDAMAKKFKEKANAGTGDASRWRDISESTDEAAAAQIRQDRIDILIDLAGHTNGGRLALFTRKPAPVQMTAWGFAHGTGLPEIDYFLADPIAIQPEEREFYAEKIIDLPCIITYEAPESYDLKGPSPAPCKRNGYITYGCFARYEKLSSECLAAFGEILRRVPDSKLEFKDAAFRRPHSIRRVIACLGGGIEPERLLFSGPTDHRDHLLSYQGCDIMLSPWPHSGGCVTCEILWMGVPLVTLDGSQPSARSGSSVLTAMGRTNWIAHTPEQYIDIAVQMAQDCKPLNEVRKTLREEFLNSPVVANYVPAVERAYREAWERWCQQ